MRADIKERIASAWPLAFLLLGLFALLCGCTRTIYKTLETTARDSTAIERSFSEQQFQVLLSSLRQTANIRDSVIVRDSTVIVINQQGEVISRERYRDSDRNRLQTDIVELLQHKYDSIYTSRAEEFNALLSRMERVPVPVERELTKWEKLKQDVGGLALGAVGCVILYLIVWLVRRFRLKT